MATAHRRRLPARAAARLGRRARLRLPRRRHQRHPGRLGPGRRPAPVHPGPARGDGRVRGRRLRQVQRPASASAWPPPARARSTCSTGCTTPSSTTCRSWPSSARPAASAMGGSYQQEVDLLSLFKDVASDYVQMVTVPEQLPNVLDRAIRMALAERAPTAIIIPSDVQELRLRRARPRVQDGALQHSASTGRTAVPGDDAVQPRRRHPQRRHARSRSWPARAPAAPAPSSSRSPSCSAPGWPSRCWARTCCPTSCPTSPGRSGCSAPGPATR